MSFDELDRNKTVVLKHDSIFQAHQNSELPATITFLALIHFLGNTYIIYISGTSLGWKKMIYF